MGVEHSIQKGVSDFSFIIGRAMIYGGAGALVIMAAVGTVSIDLVLLSAAEKYHDQFLTGFVLGSMFSRGNTDPVPLLIASPITSGIAVILSVALGVPYVGLAIMAGWLIAATTLAIGYGIEAFAKAINPDPVDESQYESAFACCM
jgi:hypothetical protein